MTALAHTWRKVTRRGGTAQTTEASEEVATVEAETKPEVPVNPAVPKMAAERNIDLGKVKGSGRDGRILVDDLPTETPRPAKVEVSAATPPTPPTAPPSPATHGAGPESDLAHSPNAVLKSRSRTGQG